MVGIFAFNHLKITHRLSCRMTHTARSKLKLNTRRGGDEFREAMCSIICKKKKVLINSKIHTLCTYSNGYVSRVNNKLLSQRTHSFV
jgi:hypothetical protein